jgi:hypothetical protein
LPKPFVTDESMSGDFVDDFDIRAGERCGLVVVSVVRCLDQCSDCGSVAVRRYRVHSFAAWRYA